MDACGRAGTDPAIQRPRPPPNRRRDKPQLSCNLCRRRKLRCDRQHPCSTCKKRGLELSCTYVASSVPSPPPSGVQDRLRHLENLVVSYMNQNEGTGLPAALPNIRELGTSHTPSDVGSLESSSTETTYQDQTHWRSILDAITDLKEDFGGSADLKPTRLTPETSSVNSLDSPLLYGCKHCSRDEILAAVPSKEFADCLVSESFEMLELSSCAINKRDFLKQYTSFWKDPQEAPIMWLGLLFSILSIAVNFRELDLEVRSAPQPDYASISASYREKTVQCLMLGQYTRCGPYVLETLLHHFAAEFMRRRDVNNEAWIILSTTVHLANIATSGQLGVPRLINDSFVDTAEPRNLFDTDFDPDSTELPPSRPDSEPTPMLVVLSKLRTGRMCTAVSSIVTNTQPPTYAQVLQVDRQIEDMFLRIPEYCRIKPQSESLADPPTIILQRIFIEMNHYKAQVILHWRYLTLTNKDDRYSYSIKKTVSAALQILKLHQTLYEGLKTVTIIFWLVSSSELSEIKQTLRQTKVIWGPKTPMSSEVKRAAAAIESAVPGILENDTDGTSNESQAPTPAESLEPITFSNDEDPFAGSMLPFFDPMFEGVSLFPSNINDMGAFIDSVLAGSVDPCVEMPRVAQVPRASAAAAGDAHCGRHWAEEALDERGHSECHEEECEEEGEKRRAY
ncbi:hypothetical protein NUW58_g516 [Xylaria curta]|uniref:Uncharacterized protein n=1 Tax=Xylaria curta TaxID=42375 RepID=A0ACC1PRI1_9PEZI|nr:hypothetical protein NUW58_g516 [Xylaria curta]